MNLRGRLGWVVFATCTVCACAAAATVVIESSSAAQASPSGTLIGVTERDFGITLTTAHVTAGDAVLRIHNTGPDQHELIVAPVHRGYLPRELYDRTYGFGGLPLRSDGLTVDEETIQSSEPGSIEPQQPGGTEDLKLHLNTGRYVLFCNMEGHFMSGMHTILVVTR
jgi:uncharacterized cupredoxin-like copper-binding protein